MKKRSRFSVLAARFVFRFGSNRPNANANVNTNGAVSTQKSEHVL